MNTRKFLTIKERVGLADLLRQVCGPAPQDPSRCVYQPDWNDLRVSAQLNIRLEVVRKNRQNLLGKLYREPRASRRARPIAVDVQREQLLELSAVLARVAVATAELAEALGDPERGRILRGLAVDAERTEL